MGVIISGTLGYCKDSSISPGPYKIKLVQFHTLAAKKKMYFLNILSFLCTKKPVYYDMRARSLFYGTLCQHIQYTKPRGLIRFESIFQQKRYWRGLILEYRISSKISPRLIFFQRVKEEGLFSRKISTIIHSVLYTAL